MRKLLTIFAAIAVSACASQPEEIHTVEVSDLQYQAYDCEQLHGEAVRVSDRANDLRRSLKETADNDAAQVGVGLILFWPALFLVEGGDGAEANEYARLKGEKEAIERVSVLKKCAVNFAPAPTLETASTVENSISPAPSAASPAPSTASPAPSVASPAPSAASPAPSVASPAPSAASPAPSAASPVPSVASPVPSVASPAPSTASPAPSTASPAPSTASPAPSIASTATYGDLEKPRPGDKIDGRLLAELFQKNTAKGTLFNCDLKGNTVREERNEIEIQFRDSSRANVRIRCSYSHSIPGFIYEDMDVKWQINGNELCFFDVPENPSSFIEDCNPVALEKSGYDVNNQKDSGLSFVLEGPGLPSSTAEQIDRAFSRVKSQS